MFMLVLSIGYVSAQGKADIKFDKTSHNFGTFSENDPVVSCVFTFTNVGDAPLVIHQAVASCGCTVPEYNYHYFENIGTEKEKYLHDTELISALSFPYFSLLIIRHSTF